jgi:patatin-like phospholipase/acyl hydrolase
MARRVVGNFQGGGVRGCIIACFLIELCQQTAKTLLEIFSMVDGCSTGGLIAAAICAGLTPEEILEIYQVDSPEIFNKSVDEAWPERILKGYAFDSDKVAATLNKRFGSAANWTLNDCPIDIMLCTTGVNGHSWYMVKDNPKNAQTTGKLSLVQCATASAAAPTYLTPVYVNPTGGTLIGWQMDGGIACNADPVYEACVEAFYYNSYDPASTIMLDFGTGYSKNTTANPPSGFIGMLSLTLDSLLFNAGKKQRDTVQRHWPGILRDLNCEIPPTDEADAAAIPQLIEIGKKAAALVDWGKILA